MTTEKDRAKEVIVEIIRQAGGEFHNKTNMYKAFWKAHLEFAKENPGYLSMWPIVRMPNGPGIDNFDELIGELISDGVLEIDQVCSGGFEAFRFTLKDTASSSTLLTDAVTAVKAGVDFVKGRSAASVSADSHTLSRSWNEASKDGEELNIYIDLLSAEEYERKKQKMKTLASVFDNTQS